MKHRIQLRLKVMGISTGVEFGSALVPDVACTLIDSTKVKGFGFEFISMLVI